MPSSVVVSNLNIECVPVFPAKTNSILAIDPNCMLPLAIVFKGMQFISRRDFQIVQPRRGINQQPIDFEYVRTER